MNILYGITGTYKGEQCYDRSSRCTLFSAAGQSSIFMRPGKQSYDVGERVIVESQEAKVYGDRRLIPQAVDRFARFAL